jgi:hypothetical protein
MSLIEKTAEVVAEVMERHDARQLQAAEADGHQRRWFHCKRTFQVCSVSSTARQYTDREMPFGRLTLDALPGYLEEAIPAKDEVGVYVVRGSAVVLLSIWWS